MMGLGLYTSQMHRIVLDEMELGLLAAMALDAEACGFGPVYDVSVDDWLVAHGFEQRNHGEDESRHP